MTDQVRNRAFGRPFQTHSDDWVSLASDGSYTYPWRAGVGTEVQGTQYTVSSEHPGWRKVIDHGGGDVGGDFYTSKSYHTGPGPTVDGVYWSDLAFPQHKWKGTVIPNIYDAGCTIDSTLFPPNGGSSDSDLAELGTTAIASCEPTRSVADLSTGIGELMVDGLPALPLINSFKKRAKICLDAGDQYLNIAFGWLPLVNDVTKTSRFIQEHDRLIAQFERDSGRAVRRRFRFPSKSSTELIGWAPSRMLMGQGTEIGQMSGPAGIVYHYREVEESTWFSGSFTYYLPSDLDGRDGISNAASSAKQLLGVELNPEVLWNLTPWSWAADWFTNAGDYSHNLSAFADNGLVLHHGYIMKRTKVSNVFVHDGPSGVVTNSGTRRIDFITETKQRQRATPYGFGLSMDSLSDFQKSILIALGMRRK